MKIVNPTMSLILRNSSFSLLSGISLFFRSPLSKYFALSTAAQIICAIGLSLLEKIGPNVCLKLRMKYIDLNKINPRIQLSMIAITIVSRFIFYKAAIVASISLGIYSSIVTCVEHYKVQQYHNLKKEKEKENE